MILIYTLYVLYNTVQYCTVLYNTIYVQIQIHYMLQSLSIVSNRNIPLNFPLREYPLCKKKYDTFGQEPL